MTVFRVTASFAIPIVQMVHGGRRVDTERLKQFWELAVEIAEKPGCYIFSVRAGKGEKPWYVGKASRQPLSKVCFSDHKIVIYDRVIGDHKGAPRPRSRI